MKKLTYISKENGSVYFMDNENKGLHLEPHELTPQQVYLILNKLANYENKEQKNNSKSHFKSGDEVWVLNDKDLSISGLIYLGSCNDYVIVSPIMINSNGRYSFEDLLKILQDNSKDEELGTSILIFHKSVVFPNKEKALNELELLDTPTEI